MTELPTRDGWSVRFDRTPLAPARRRPLWRALLSIIRRPR